MRDDIHPPAIEVSSLSFEQPALQARHRLLRQKPPARADHAVPRNALSGGARRNRESGCPRPARQPQHLRELPIRNNPPARDLLHQRVNSAPATRNFSHFPPRFSSSARLQFSVSTRLRANLKRRSSISHLINKKGLHILSQAARSVPRRIFDTCSSASISLMTDTMQPCLKSSIIPLTA